jgi:protein-tyrosine phosphatase/arsenate reductase
MFDIIKEHCDALVNNFKEIPLDRKLILEKIAQYIKHRLEEGLDVNLVYVCTHNSRRSHLGQVWAAVAASYFDIGNVKTFSGGTEATAFNPNAIKALISSGFEVIKKTESGNPIYHVFYGEDESTDCFSKIYNHDANPSNNFAAIMTCSDAEENCPLIIGCDFRIGTTYHDPKAYDHTVLQEEKYIERSNQIAMECLYVFSAVNNL